MALFLIELSDLADPIAALGAVDAAEGADVIEAQVTSDRARAFVVVEAETPDLAARAADAAQVSATSPAQVRLVGADLDDIKAARPQADYLVEWDIPESIDMDTYLAGKIEKMPLYGHVPEVSFLRTYVREDMVKCLCFYDGPDEDAVRRARDAVSTPIDRLHVLSAIKV